MTNATDTLEGTAAAQAASALASVLTGKPVPTPTPAEPAPQDTPAPAAGAKPAEQAPPADSAPQTPTPSEPAAEPSPYDSVVASVLGDTPATIQWGDDAKNLFKTTFGVEDPLEFKKQVDLKDQKLSLVEKEVDELKPLKQAFESMPPAAHVAFQKLLQGDAKGAQEYLKSIPTVALENKEAAELSDRVLVDTYFEGKVKPEQWNLLNDPEADSDVVDAFKTKVSMLREAAEIKHDARRNEAKELAVKFEADQKAAHENYITAVAATIAEAKSTPLGVFVPQIENEIRSGHFVTKFVQPDGVTPTKEAATLLLKGLHFDQAVKAAEERGYARGASGKRQEDTSRMPPAVSAAARSAGDQPTVETQQQQINKIMLGVFNR